MEGEAKRQEIQTLLEAIKGSDVLERKVSLISQLEDSFQSATDHILLVEYLIIFWEENTCAGVSHCMLNKTILQIAIKCMEIDKITSLSQFLVLGSKASSWCEQHLKEAIGLIDESDDQNHSNIFQQILFDALNFSSNLVSVLTSSPISNDVNLMLITESFIFELLNLTRSSLMNNKTIHSGQSEIFKLTQVILEGIKSLCIKCSETQNDNQLNKNAENSEKYFEFLAKITARAIQTLHELGIYASKGGGSHVTLLNLSWKGIVTLLQNNKENLKSGEKIVDVGEIVQTLISLSLEKLKKASENWDLLGVENEILSISEAKRAFLPVKFFLINAVRICSAFPSEAVEIIKDILRCELVISNLWFYFSKEAKLKTASEALAEFVGPTSFLLLQTVLNSFNMDLIAKFGIFECLFETKQEINSAKMENSDSLACIFSTDFDDLLPGGAILYLNLLRNSPSLNENILIELSKNLDNLFNILINERIYPFVLGLEIPVLHNSKGSGTNEITWQSFYNFAIQSLKSFVISASEVIFPDLETIFLENLFHPHFLISEITTEILCFIIRNSEIELKNQIIENILSLLKSINSPLEDLRRIARVLNTLLIYVGPDLINRVYNVISSDELCDIYLVLLMEGFPFEELSENVKKYAIKRLFSAFNAFLEGYFRENGGSSSDLTGEPVHALASSLCYCDVKNYDEMLEEKTIHLFFKFTNSIINNYKNTTNNFTKISLAKLIGSTLDIISSIKFLYNYHAMHDLISNLHSIFIPNSNPNTNSTNLLHNYKPSLARFISSLSHMKIPEEENNITCTNIWQLNHVLLRERNWALVHLAISSFGYFAARTSCTQLWRFVPDNAALSYDNETGMVSNENRFMCELKAFLEKENAINMVCLDGNEIERLEKEGRLISKFISDKMVELVDEMEICEERERRKRKIPEGFSEGLGLLRNGLKVVRVALDGIDLPDLRGEFSKHIASLENVISNLVCLSDSH